jgi:hypothetical protein
MVFSPPAPRPAVDNSFLLLTMRRAGSPDNMSKGCFVYCTGSTSFAAASFDGSRAESMAYTRKTVMSTATSGQCKG